MGDVVRVSTEIARALMETGLSIGTVTTDFGPAVIRRAMLNGIGVYSITFPELEEKWIVTDGLLKASKYTAIPEGEVLPPAPIVKPPIITEDFPPGIDLEPGGLQLIPNKEEKRMEKKEKRNTKETCNYL